MKRAETIADVGVLPLSRRDRAAMELALEAMRVRINALDARIADELASDAIEVARSALKCASSWCVAGELCAWLRYAQRRVPPRLLRARLALAIRVLLRMNRGDWPAGSLRCCGCGWSARAEAGLDPATPADRARWQKCPVDPMEWDEPVRAPWEYDLRVRPLWQDAPPHDGPTPAERRRLREVG